MAFSNSISVSKKGATPLPLLNSYYTLNHVSVALLIIAILSLGTINVSTFVFKAIDLHNVKNLFVIFLGTNITSFGILVFGVTLAVKKQHCPDSPFIQEKRAFYLRQIAEEGLVVKSAAEKTERRRYIRDEEIFEYIAEKMAIDDIVKIKHTFSYLPKLDQERLDSRIKQSHLMHILHVQNEVNNYFNSKDVFYEILVANYERDRKDLSPKELAKIKKILMEKFTSSRKWLVNVPVLVDRGICKQFELFENKDFEQVIEIYGWNFFEKFSLKEACSLKGGCLGSLIFKEINNDINSFIEKYGEDRFVIITKFLDEDDLLKLRQSLLDYYKQQPSKTYSPFFALLPQGFKEEFRKFVYLAEYDCEETPFNYWSLSARVSVYEEPSEKEIGVEVGGEIFFDCETLVESDDEQYERFKKQRADYFKAENYDEFENFRLANFDD